MKNRYLKIIINKLWLLNWNSYLELIEHWWSVLDENTQKGSLRSVVANARDWNVVVGGFELWSHHYIHFRTYTLRKMLHLLIPRPAMN